MKIAKDAALFGTLPENKPFVVTIPVQVAVYAETHVKAAMMAHGEVGSALLWDNEEFPPDVVMTVQQFDDNGLPIGEVWTVTDK